MRGGGDGDDWPLRSSSGVSSPVGGRDATEDVAGETEVGGGGLSGGGGGDGGLTVSKKKQSLFKTLWEFSRPHTMVRGKCWRTIYLIPALGAPQFRNMVFFAENMLPRGMFKGRV